MDRAVRKTHRNNEEGAERAAAAGPEEEVAARVQRGIAEERDVLGERSFDPAEERVRPAPGVRIREENLRHQAAEDDVERHVLLFYLVAPLPVRLRGYSVGFLSQIVVLFHSLSLSLSARFQLGVGESVSDRFLVEAQKWVCETDLPFWFDLLKKEKKVVITLEV